ncbi:MAG: LOG family protein [Methylacidiphilales bacterium]|nr:LOG family protein [Candidatus Methylacidiphilales bacterium]MDW8349372.1 LOG family protein [Verrucomicrobiae bacterium]
MSSVGESKPLYSTGKAELDAKVKELVVAAGIPEVAQRDYEEMVISVLRLALEGQSPADRRLINQALKEIRYASKVFAPYQGVKKICIFGSARISPRAPEYQAAKEFAAMMRDAGYMIITGGGDGIMGAAQAGAGRDRSFGLNIRLPFEQKANPTIEGDPKLINFRYFFTRKLHFVKETHAIALFPGGFGTMDEGFEALTLIQTGKSRILPMVLIDAPGGNFWHTFEKYLREHLLNDGLISKEDFNLFKITDDLKVAQREVLNFYYNFHSYRFVDQTLVIRMQREVPPGALRRIQMDFEDILIDGGDLKVCPALPQEINEPEIAHLPRLCLNFDRKSYGRLRQLIDRINEF